MGRGPCTRPGTALQRPGPWVLRRYADGRTAFAGPCKTAAMDRSQRALAGSGGLAVLPPRTRPYARWWLLALLLAVFPANVHMALNPEEIDGST